MAGERPGDAVRERFRRVLGAVPRRGTYIYQPINPLCEIRILRIFHGTGDDPLECMLYKSALVPTGGQPSSSECEKWPYPALSYWWGDENETAGNPITIINDTGGRGPQQLTPFNIRGTFFIRNNLKAAIKQLRRPLADEDIWVDAICINQDDKAEKNAQVSRMHEIYSQAESVSIWLGQGTPKTHETFEFLNEILDLYRLDEFMAQCDNNTAQKWKLIIDLMGNRWFSRRWVIQELAYSREAYVLWGSERMEWSNFADAISLFMTKYKIIKREYAYNPLLSSPLDAHALGPNMMVNAMTNLFRRSQDGRIRRRLIPLEVLVSSMLTGFEASEPCDTIYAVRTLANDCHFAETGGQARAEDPRLFPDYDKRLFDVYTDFISYCIETSQSLDILCRYWALPPKLRVQDRLAGREEERLPTWIPLITFSAFGEPKGMLGGRVNGDSFVGVPERKGRQTYNASSRLAPHATFGMLEPPRRSHPASPKYNGTLSVRGFRLGSIAEVSDRVTGKGVIQPETLEMGGWRRGTGQQDVPDQLWRTLVADRGPDGTSTPGWYKRTCLACLQRVNRSGELDIEEVINQRHPRTPSTMVTFLERVQRIVWKRRFFKIRYRPPTGGDELLFALGPPAATPGSIVCILFGCSVPVVLRKKGGGGPGDYELLGECYVHGMMDGEAIPHPPPEHPYEGGMYETFNLK